MKVILTEKIRALGNVGEIVNVTAGYARNCLIPGKLAVLADDANKNVLANNQKRLSKKVDAQKAAATEMKKKIDGITLKLVKRIGSNGKLFGTVTNTDLAKELFDKGIEVERRLIAITDPIKTLGETDVIVKLFKDVEALFKVKVEMDPEQVKEIKARQEAALKRGKSKKKEEGAEAEAAQSEGEVTEDDSSEE